MMKYLSITNKINLLFILCILASCQSRLDQFAENGPVRDTLNSIIKKNELDKTVIKQIENENNILQLNVTTEIGLQFVINKIPFRSNNERILKMNDKPLIIGELFKDKEKKGEYTIGFSEVDFGELLLEINSNNIVSHYLLSLKPNLVTNTMESLYRMVEVEESVKLFPLDSLIHQNQYNINIARESYPNVNNKIKSNDSALYSQLIELERQIESNSTNAKSFQKLGELYIETNHEELYNTINRCFIQSLNLGNNGISLIYSLAYSEFLLGNYDKATDYYIKATQSGWTNDYYDLHDRLEVYLLRRGY